MNLGYTEKINEAKVPSVQANSESEAKCQIFQVNPKSSKLLDLNLTSLN